MLYYAENYSNKKKLMWFNNFKTLHQYKGLFPHNPIYQKTTMTSLMLTRNRMTPLYMEVNWHE